MLQLRVFGASAAMADVAEQLEALAGSRHVVRTGDGGSGNALVTADLADDAVDPALDRIMGAAGVVAAFGVIYSNDILVVGAMAISPDTLPITATATALVLRRWRLAARALTTLTAGLGVAWIVGGVMTSALNHLELLPSGFVVGKGGFLQALSSANVSTPIVAFAAGVAGMLALETRASASVGVAISVTTIPASAYLGVAVGVGEASKAAGALAVLGINVAMLLAGGCLTLLAQRAMGRRTAGQAAR